MRVRPSAAQPSSHNDDEVERENVKIAPRGYTIFSVVSRDGVRCASSGASRGGTSCCNNVRISSICVAE